MNERFIQAYERFTKSNPPYTFVEKPVAFFFRSFEFRFDGDKIMKLNCDYETAVHITKALNAAFFEGWYTSEKERFR